MTSTESSNILQMTDRVARLMSDQRIADVIAKNTAVEPQVREACEWLVKQHDGVSDKTLLTALDRVLPALLAGSLRVFFSYKAKDKQIARQIASKLESWSAGKLKVKHMYDLQIEEPGRDWREKLERMIPQCDWFLLLLPSPGDDRDWVHFEAGYFFRGQGLTGRLICLHHPDNKVADALDALESVPAEAGSVQAFLEGLFHKPNWIPGMPPLNEYLDHPDVKAREIVELIQPPVGPAERSWCGPHMEVAFEDASAVRGWEQLSLGHVIESNRDCMRLFRLDVTRRLFGDWVKAVAGAGQDEGWVMEFAGAVQAAGEGRQVPAIRATFGLDDQSRVRPQICALRRRKSDGRLEAVDILFNEIGLPPETTLMPPELAALAITLQYAVRFRYQVLEHYVGRELVGKDVLAFNRAVTTLMRETARDPRFAADPLLIRKKTLASFVGEDKAVVQKMYERADQLWRPDGEGEMDRAILNLDGKALAGFVQELLYMNQRFLEVTSKRFAELIAGL